MSESYIACGQLRHTALFQFAFYTIQVARCRQEWCSTINSGGVLRYSIVREEFCSIVGVV